MKIKKIIAIIIFLLGIGMLFVSYDIKKKVAEGTLKVRKAEKTVNQANSLFSLSPTAKQLTQESLQGAQKKIEAGKADIAYYSKLADQLQLSGLVLMGAGILIFVLGREEKSEKNKKR